MKTIVAGYDGSEQGERALARAAQLVQPMQAELVVVSVGRPELPAASQPALEAIPELVPTPLGPMMPGGLLPGPAPPVRAPQPQEPPEEELLLERARSFLVPRRIEADYVARIGDPAAALLQVADEHDADLIVVGRGEHGLLDRLLGRAVDEKLARQADCDLLLVR